VRVAATQAADHANDLVLEYHANDLAGTRTPRSVDFTDNDFDRATAHTAIRVCRIDA